MSETLLLRKCSEKVPRVHCFLTLKIGGIQLLFSQRFIENNLFEVPELLSNLYEVRRGLKEEVGRKGKYGIAILDCLDANLN